jgi:hypothetical protein
MIMMVSSLCLALASALRLALRWQCFLGHGTSIRLLEELIRIPDDQTIDAVDSRMCVWV